MIFEFSEIRLLCVNQRSLGRHYLHRVHFLQGLHRVHFLQGLHHHHRLLISRFLRFEIHLPHHFLFSHHLILLHDIHQFHHPRGVTQITDKSFFLIDI